MLKTGFGVAGDFSAMWSFDMSRKSVPDFEAVVYPPRGAIPSSHFKAEYAWSVSPNSQKYREPDSSIKVTVTPLEFDPDKLSVKRNDKPLDIEYIKVSAEGFGGAPCIIFRPRGVSLATWSAYVVELSGLKDLKGQDVPVQYVVAFYSPADVKPIERTKSAHAP
jgi:hypothetical protein